MDMHIACSSDLLPHVVVARLLLSIALGLSLGTTLAFKVFRFRWTPCALLNVSALLYGNLSVVARPTCGTAYSDCRARKF